MRTNPPLFLRTGISVVVAATCVFAASCSLLTRPAPERMLFAIDPGEPPQAALSHASSENGATATPEREVLRVRRLRVASPYDGNGFVYRTHDDQFRTDYYNGFIAAPAELLTTELIGWLSRAGPFEAVVDAASAVPARYVLEGNVTALYGDYADQAAPRAVLAIRIFVLDQLAKAQIVFQKEYQATAPITSGSATSLVKGWSSAFRSALEQIAADLTARHLYETQKMPQPHASEPGGAYVSCGSGRAGVVLPDAIGFRSHDACGGRPFAIGTGVAATYSFTLQRDRQRAARRRVSGDEGVSRRGRESRIWHCRCELNSGDIRPIRSKSSARI